MSDDNDNDFDNDFDNDIDNEFDNVPDNDRYYIGVTGGEFCVPPIEDEANFEPPRSEEWLDLPFAPRSLGATTYLSLLTGSSYGSGIGLGLLLFVWIFVFFFMAQGRSLASIAELFMKWEPYATAVVTSNEEENVSINGSSPYMMRFEEDAPDGSRFHGVSYSFRPVSPGTEVAIERRVGSQDVLCIEGASIARYGSFKTQVWFVAVFGALVIFGAYVGIINPIRKGLINVKLLRDGALAYGKAVACRHTGVSYNSNLEYAVTIRFQTDDGALCNIDFKTLRPGDLFKKNAIAILYNTEKPSQFLPLDSLPRGVKLKPNEGFTASALRPTLVFLLVAALFGMYAWACYESTRFQHAEFTISSTEAPASAPTITEEHD